ncbi:uncharacterized protein F4817DRAFT_177352 [Daldinia loculata]|uniref:uncharacterized protein n=1 Tax=Daldinia loculata TaxID=103429 RepID=UPI0020C1BD65|nr:uncharacterized protein F4817DRAFT_177352 [Daldinia loculata]KAI1651142.1 hypothetical protein F4817DRAFT_177352 [Daldinia loculata]
MANNDMVNRGMTQVFTGLGILLGAGRISNATHEKIMGLIDADQNRANTDATPTAAETTIGLPGPGKETPVSMRSQDLLGLGDEFGDMSIGDKYSRGSTKSAGAKSGSQPKIICPWWSTAGYACRDYENGECKFYHEDITDGIRQPLICHFWADGNRCTKPQDACRFAHYLAQHRAVAPMPTKRKIKKTSTGLDYSEHFAIPRPAVLSRESEVGKWHSQPRPPPEDDW